MLQEMKLEDALKKFLQGKEVLVMYNESLEPEKPTYTVESIKEALKNWRFLAEVPAVENQDFKQAVKEMVELGTEAKKRASKGSSQAGACTPDTQRKACFTGDDALRKRSRTRGKRCQKAAEHKSR